MSLASFIQDAKRWADQHRNTAVDHADKTYKTQQERDGYVAGHSDGFMCVVPPRFSHDRVAYDQGYRDGQKASG